MRPTTTQPTTRPSRNGAAVPSTPPRSRDSSWLRRPTAAKAMTMATSSPNAATAHRTGSGRRVGRSASSSGAASMRTDGSASLGGGEATELALVEHQRDVDLGVVVEVEHGPDHEVVVAELEHPLDRAVDPRPRTVEDGAAGDRRRVPRHVVEAIVEHLLAGELPAEVALAVAKHVDAEGAVRGHRRPRLAGDHG